MKDHVLALDLGTTRTKAMVLGPGAEVLGQAAAPACWGFPAPGRIEQDPEALWQQLRAVAREALVNARVAPTALAAIGLTGQRASCLVWDRDSSQPLSPIVGWQDGRGEARARALGAMGFPVMHVQSAAKLEAIVDEALRSSPGARNRWVFGDLLSFAILRMTEGRHVTDATLAQATGYLDAVTLGWSEELLGLQRIEPGRFPEVLPSRGYFGTATAGFLGAEIPVLAVLGDQQAASSAAGCDTPGACGITFGTAAIADVCTGSAPAPAPGVYPVLMWQLQGAPAWGLEGMVVTAGAALEHLVRLGVLPRLGALDSLVASAADAGGVHFLPALEGLGSPFMAPHRSGTLTGLRLGTGPAHIARAAVDGIAYRVRQVLDAFADGAGVAITTVRADGGASASDALMQAQADALGLPVECGEVRDGTSYGAGLLAGAEAGLWPASAAPAGRPGRVFTPRGSDSQREARYATWCDVFKPF